MEELATIRTACRTGPKSRLWSSHGHATHPVSASESTRTSLSRSTNVVELDSEVLRLPTTSLRFGVS